MPQISHDQRQVELESTAREFSAVKHVGDEHVRLEGPNLLRVYERPQLGQGAVFSFGTGDRPEIVMILEKLGDRIGVRLAKMTSERVEVFHGGSIFSDIENNYVEQML